MELRDELLDSLILDNTYIKLEDLDKKDKLEKNNTYSKRYEDSWRV